MGRVAVFDREISFDFQCKGLDGLCQGGTATGTWGVQKSVPPPTTSVDRIANS